MSTFILAFDHRNSLLTTFFEVTGEPTDPEVAAASEVKRVIADGLLAAIERKLVGADEAGALVDSTYGADAIDALKDAGVRVAVPVEASGRREFAFEHSDWRERLDATRPTWAKVLVRYNTGRRRRDERTTTRTGCSTSRRWRGRSAWGSCSNCWCRPSRTSGPRSTTREVRPDLVVRGLEELRKAGIAPDLWKIEGLDRREDCARVADVAGAPCVVLGRGADAAAVERWLRAAAGVPGSTGSRSADRSGGTPFAPTWTVAPAGAAAVTAIADRYGHFVDVYRDGTN